MSVCPSVCLSVCRESAPRGARSRPCFHEPAPRPAARTRGRPDAPVPRRRPHTLPQPLLAPQNLAVAKTSLTFGQAFSRAVLCNMMVCIGLWMATACYSFPGKFMAAWVAVSTFSAIGFEHRWAR
jgi:hypothetical protein